MKNFQPEQVIAQLRRKTDVERIDIDTKTIRVNRSNNRKNDLGNGSWGKIDFLVNHCGFKVV